MPERVTAPRQPHVSDPMSNNFCRHISTRPHSRLCTEQREHECDARHKRCDPQERCHRGTRIIISSDDSTAAIRICPPYCVCRELGAYRSYPGISLQLTNTSDRNSTDMRKVFSRSGVVTGSSCPVPSLNNRLIGRQREKLRSRHHCNYCKERRISASVLI